MEFSKLIYFPFTKILVFVFFGIVIGLLIETNLVAIFIVIFLGVLLYFYLRSPLILYLTLTFSSGLLLSLNLDFKTRLTTTDKFTYFKAFAFGRVTDVYRSQMERAKIRIEGKIWYLGKEGGGFACLLNVYSRDSALPKFDEGDELSFSGLFRLPRTSQLPTDPNELINALANDVDLFGVTDLKNIIYIHKKHSFFASMQKEINDYLKRKLLYLFPNQKFSLFSAILLADRRFIPDELYRKFSLSGVAHILALSGFHIGIIATFVFFLFSFIKNQWFKFLLVSITLLFYLFVIGYPASAVRATIMVLAFLFASTISRNSYTFNILAFVLLFALAFFPNMLFSPGFQMSYFSVLSLSIFSNRFMLLFRKLIPKETKVIGYIISMLATTISVQLLLAPVLAYYFGFFTFISYIANLFILPLFSIGIIYGFVSLIISLFIPTVATYFSASADICIELAKLIISNLSNNLSFFVIKNDLPILTSILISLSFVLLLFSKTVIDFFARLGILFLIIFSFNEFLNTPSKEIAYFPRKNFVFISFKLPNRSICFILDKKPREKPQIDSRIADFVKLMGGNLSIGYSGNIGISFIDYLKEEHKFKSFYIIRDLQIKLSKWLFGDLSIFIQRERIWRFD